jgi:hypothetical protein
MLEMLEAGLPPTKEIVLATPLPESWWPRLDSNNA